MKVNKLNLKLIIGVIYLSVISIGLYFLFSVIDIKDLTSYEFIRANRDVILEYKKENFLILISAFFIFSIIWVLLLGFATPLLLFARFVFGKWWGIILVSVATTVGATLLYLLVSFFFQATIKSKLESKFSNLREYLIKNDLLYYTSFRFIGGGGTPYVIQNIIPVLFNMSVKNYILATFMGSMPSMFVTVSLGSGIENVIDHNSTLNFYNVLFSPEIYLPIVGFVIIMLLAFIVKKHYFK